MIECPWCHQQVRLYGDICPECQHEVLESHLQELSESEYNNAADEAEPAVEVDDQDSDIEAMIMGNFNCAKCGHSECRVDEAAMTGTGLSKLLDVQYKHFLFVSCEECAYVEIYNPDILRARKAGMAGTALDLLF